MLLGEVETPGGADEPMTGLTINEIESLQATVQSAFDSIEKKQSLQARLPSFPEWNHAFSNIELEPGVVEILSDAAATSHRGGMMDGRPRPVETPMAHSSIIDLQLKCILEKQERMQHRTFQSTAHFQTPWYDSSSLRLESNLRVVFQ